MKNPRRQDIDASQPFELHLAADARHSRSDYADDQAWTARLGKADEAALAFQTRYGGRAGLASLAPIWRFGEQVVYQARAYHRQPQLRGFAPDLVLIQAAPIAGLELEARFWVMESRAAGGELRLRNDLGEPIELQFELFGHVVINGEARKLNVLTKADGALALHLGQIGNINPVLALDGAQIEIYGGRVSSPKLGKRFSVEPGAELVLRFAAAGLEDMRDSFSVAMNWAARDWQPHFARVDRDSAAIPQIQTGKASWDRVIDLSYKHLVGAFIGPTEHLPQASFVANRAIHRGWSRRGDGSDHIRAWAGQDPTLAWLAAPVIATVDGDLAKGVVRNYLATQDASGFVDRQPGLAGQRQGLLMMPLLARLAWTVYERTEDRAFLAEVFPGLLAFFGRWLAADLDADDDGAPEWQSERQTGYIAFPTFSEGQLWAQGADIRQMETPDLLAYLISEAEALRQAADELGESEAAPILEKQRDMLEASLEEFWDGKRYAYRDRDSHLSPAGEDLLRGAPADQPQEVNHAFAQPSRVMIRVVGGLSQRPRRLRLKLEGADEHGEPYQIEATTDDFAWRNRGGIYTSERPLSRVHRIAFDGLSRVYKIYASAIDCSRLDVNALLPLFSGRLNEDRAEALARLAMDEEHFLRPRGLTMVSARDPSFDPSNARGGGGVWMFWLSLVGEGLLQAGYRAEATNLLQRVLAGLARVLEREGKLSRFYHADEAKGYGEDHHIGGIAPLKLLSDVLGALIPAGDRAWVGGEFSWGQPVSVKQHGLTVTRDAERIQIQFPSGAEVELPADAPWQLVRDPSPSAARPADDAPAPPSEPPLPSQVLSEGRVEIEIEEDSDQNSQENDAAAPAE